MSRPYLKFNTVIKEIMKSGNATKDINFDGGLSWKIREVFNNKCGEWQLGLNQKLGIVYHVFFKPD